MDGHEVLYTLFRFPLYWTVGIIWSAVTGYLAAQNKAGVR